MTGANRFDNRQPAERALLRRLRVEGRDARGNRHTATWNIAEETPVEIGFNGRPWIVMLATPNHLDDLVIGLSCTEGVITGPRDVADIEIRDYPEGITVNMAVTPECLNDRGLRFRVIEGRTGCGLCGVETLADTVRPAGTRPDPAAVDDLAVLRAFAHLKNHQPLNETTRSVHAAAWCSPGGEVLEVREDVGRHNALDKLIGARLRAGAGPVDGFIIMTSRCSMELVQKASFFGAPLLATMSAPTLRALKLAAATGLSVKCLGPEDTVMTFNLEAPGAKV